MNNPCEHEDFDVMAKVARLTKEDGGPVYAYNVEIRVSCKHCGAFFEWVGLPPGMSPRHPTVDLDMTTLCAPLTPQGVEADTTGPGYTVRVHQRNPISERDVQ